MEECHTLCILPSLSIEQEVVLTAVYKFSIETAAFNSFLADKNGISPLMLAVENFTENACVTDFINRDVPKQYDKNDASYFHYLAKADAPGSRIKEIKRMLMTKNLDLDATVLGISE